MTNGEVIETLFPNVGTNFSNVLDLNLWWKAPCKAETKYKWEQTDNEDCISRESVFQIFDEACYIDGDWYVMREKIEKLPSVTPTRPKGKWKILDECANEGVYCSKCHKTVFKLDFSHTMKWRNFKYCPNCGAKMEVENEKETC